MTTLQVLTLLLNKFRVSLYMNSIVPVMVVCCFVGAGGKGRLGEVASGTWVEGLARFPLMS